LKPSQLEGNISANSYNNTSIFPEPKKETDSRGINKAKHQQNLFFSSSDESINPFPPLSPFELRLLNNPFSKKNRSLRQKYPKQEMRENFWYDNDASKHKTVKTVPLFPLQNSLQCDDRK